jgi:O-antigen/teichoic acid export membrane protein
VGGHVPETTSENDPKAATDPLLGLAVSPELEPLHFETLHAIRNSLKLGISLVVTWGIAVVVRVFLPRYLGPQIFGGFQFADSFTTGFFILTSLGIDTYIRKEIGIRREHASDFFGGILTFRLLIGVVAVAVMMALLAATGRAPNVQHLVLLFSMYQFFLVLNNSYAALLHAAAVVDTLVVLNVTAKLFWGSAIFVAFAAHGGAQAVVIGLTLSELLKAIALTWLVRREVGLRFRVDLRQVWPVLASSTPFYVSDLAYTMYAQVQVSMMAFLANDTEVGWYGAASNLSGLALLLTPLITWVLLPMSARAAARSDEELTILARRALELILIIAIPCTLLMFLGADVLAVGIFGPDYAPAARILRILAPMFVLTHVAIVGTTILIRLGRGWTATRVSLAGLALNAALNWFLIPLGLRTFGQGGAGVGAASALVLSESFVTVFITCLVVRRAFDRRNLIMIAKTAAACAIVLFFDKLLPDFGFGRLAIDAALYFVLVLSSNAIRLEEIIAFVRLAVRRNEE